MEGPRPSSTRSLLSEAEGGSKGDVRVMSDYFAVLVSVHSCYSPRGLVLQFMIRPTTHDPRDSRHACQRQDEQTAFNGTIMSFPLGLKFGNRLIGASGFGFSLGTSFGFGGWDLILGKVASSRFG